MDIQTQMPVKLTNGTNTAGITGSNALQVDLSQTGVNTNAIKVDGSGVTQPVSIAATVGVSGTVAVSNFPASQTVSGTVAVSNFPATQPVSGTVSVSGTVATTTGEVSTGVVAFAGSSAAVANGAVGTITYTVTSGKTLYLKQILASASGAPCKVVVDYGATPTVVAVGFFSTAVPYLDVTLAQPIPVSSATAVNVKITNTAGVAQDVYATVFGHEI